LDASLTVARARTGLGFTHEFGGSTVAGESDAGLPAHGVKACSCVSSNDPSVPGDYEQRLADVRQKLIAIEVAPHEPDRLRYSAVEHVVDSYSLGFTRAEQAVAAVRAPSTQRAEYQQTWGDEFARLLVAVHPIRTKRWRFLLVVLAFGSDDRTREVVAALRLYPSTTDEESKLLDAPGLALATLIAKYGAAYEIERGERSIFEPSVDFERGRFVRSDRVELPEVSEALGFEYDPQALSFLVSLRVKQGGGVRLCFPIMLRTDAYRADVEIARR
jgi:hypothetical protein